MSSPIISSAVLLLALSATVCLAYPYGYDDYYHPGSEYHQGDRYGAEAEKYGHYDKAGEGKKYGWKSGDYGHQDGEYDQGAHAYGKHGGDYGQTYYNAAADKGQQHASGEHGDREAQDADGYKKYSYVSEGTGPEGYYKKGYFGSEGYDHESKKSHESKDAHGDGFAKGHQESAKEHKGKYGEFEKAGGSKGYYGKGHDQHEGGHKVGEYGHEQMGAGHFMNNHGEDFKYGTGFGHH